jgi:hypothetical protein
MDQCTLIGWYVFKENPLKNPVNKKIIILLTFLNRVANKKAL